MAMPRHYVDSDADPSALAGQQVAVVGYGNLGRPAFDSPAATEAALDMFVEQTVDPELGSAVLSAFEVGTAHGLPPEALALELYLSGEIGATWTAFAEHGFFPGVRLHGHAAAFAGSSAWPSSTPTGRSSASPPPWTTSPAAPSPPGSSRSSTAAHRPQRHRSDNRRRRPAQRSRSPGAPSHQPLTRHARQVEGHRSGVAKDLSVQGRRPLVDRGPTTRS